MFKDGELSVVDGPVASDNRSEKNGLTPQDQIDMAEMGKKQQFRVRPLLRERFCDMLAQFLPANRMSEKFWLHVHAR